MSKRRPPATKEQAPPAPIGGLRALLLLWALAVTVLFFLQPGTTDVLLSFALSLLGGGS